MSTPPEDLKCEVCQKTFKRKDYLKQHMKTHAPERDVCRCPREGCGRTYTTVFNLQSHILSFHEERRPFMCEHPGCGKTFAMKVSTRAHKCSPLGLWLPCWVSGSPGFQDGAPGPTDGESPVVWTFHSGLTQVCKTTRFAYASGSQSMALDQEHQHHLRTC